MPDYIGLGALVLVVRPINKLVPNLATRKARKAQREARLAEIRKNAASQAR